MLVVRIEIWPFGREAAKRTLGTAVIGNDGTGTPETGNYKVYATEGEAHPDGVREYPMWTANIKSYQRRRGFWALVAEALRKVDNA